MEILIAFLVVGVIGLLAGLLIAVMSRFFGVEEDQTVKAVRACLPGVNCGACGYKGVLSLLYGPILTSGHLILENTIV